MTDTETRLRDYLQAEASTIPGTTQGPGLEVDSTGSSTRRGWVPIALAAAGIAAVLTLAVPFLHGLVKHADQPSVSGLPAMGPVSAGAPRIPYTTLVQNNPDNPLDTWWAAIHDGGTTVKNPGVKGNVVARTEGGWLVTTGYPDPDKAQVAVDIATGKVTKLKLPATAKWFEQGTFEDSANVIVVDEAGPAQKLFRCAVATGECKQVAVAKPDEIIAAVQP